MPIRADIEFKLGGLQCNIVISRLKPWLLLHSSKKKKMVIREEAPVVKPKPTTDSSKIIVWTCNFSAPKMTIILFNMADSPLYHVSIGNYIYLSLFMNQNKLNNDAMHRIK